MPWVNNKHPDNVSKFVVPTKFPGVNVNDLVIEVLDNFFSFKMNPYFYKALLVLSSRPEVAAPHELSLIE